MYEYYSKSFHGRTLYTQLPAGIPRLSRQSNLPRYGACGVVKYPSNIYNEKSLHDSLPRFPPHFLGAGQDFDHQLLKTRGRTEIDPLGIRAMFDE